MNIEPLANSNQPPGRPASAAAVRIAPGRLEAARKVRGLTLQQFAGTLGHNANEKIVKLWEDGKWHPTSAQAIKMARVLHCQVDYLLGKTDVMEIPAPTEPPVAPAAPTDPVAATPPPPDRGAPLGKNIDRIDGPALRKVRVYRKLTVKDLGERTGIAHQTIGSWECGRYTGIGRDRVAWVARHLDVPPEVLAGLWEFAEADDAPAATTFQKPVPAAPPDRFAGIGVNPTPAVPPAPAAPPEERIFGIVIPEPEPAAEPDHPISATAAGLGPRQTDVDATLADVHLKVPAFPDDDSTGSLSSTVLDSPYKARRIIEAPPELAELIVGVLDQFNTAAEAVEALHDRIDKLLRGVGGLVMKNEALQAENARLKDETNAALIAQKREIRVHARALLELMEEKVRELGED